MWLFDSDALPLLVPVVASAAVVVRSWIRHRTITTRERARTERFQHLLRDCTPAQRAEILRALRGSGNLDA
ncbi:hypothetical protein GCM10028833_26320 [Glycomyces tarimensis]